MSTRNIVAILLSVVALGLLWPGLTEPVLTITATMKLLGPPQEIFRQSQSIARSVKTLYNDGNVFVAGMITLFSITVPLIKAALMAIILVTRNRSRRKWTTLT